MPIVTINHRSRIAIDGDEAEHFLHNLLTTDITGLPSGELRPGALLTAQGKVLFAFLIARTASGFIMDVATEDAADFAKRLKFFRLRAKVDIEDPEPASASVSWDGPKTDDTSLRDARFQQIEVWRTYQTHASNAADASWTQLRITHGVAEPRLDYAYGDVFPHDINLDQTAGLSFTKGCYVGQEVVSRMHHRSTARWRLMVAIGESDLSAGASITAAGKAAGTLGSVKGHQALALVRLDRIKDVFDVVADGVPITFSFPQGVSYGWPISTESAS